MFSQKFQQMMMKFDSDMMVNAVGLVILRFSFCSGFCFICILEAEFGICFLVILV